MDDDQDENNVCALCGVIVKEFSLKYYYQRKRVMCQKCFSHAIIFGEDADIVCKATSSTAQLTADLFIPTFLSSWSKRDMLSHVYSIHSILDLLQISHLLSANRLEQMSFKFPNLVEEVSLAISAAYLTVQLVINASVVMISWLSSLSFGCGRSHDTIEHAVDPRAPLISAAAATSSSVHTGFPDEYCPIVAGFEHHVSSLARFYDETDFPFYHCKSYECSSSVLPFPPVMKLGNDRPPKRPCSDWTSRSEGQSSDSSSVRYSSSCHNEHRRHHASHLATDRASASSGAHNESCSETPSDSRHRRDQCSPVKGSLKNEFSKHFCYSNDALRRKRDKVKSDSLKQTEKMLKERAVSLPRNHNSDIKKVNKSPECKPVSSRVAKASSVPQLFAPEFFVKERNGTREITKLDSRQMSLFTTQRTVSHGMMRNAGTEEHVKQLIREEFIDKEKIRKKMKMGGCDDAGGSNRSSNKITPKKNDEAERSRTFIVKESRRDVQEVCDKGSVERSERNSTVVIENGGHSKNRYHLSRKSEGLRSAAFPRSSKHYKDKAVTSVFISANTGSLGPPPSKSSSKSSIRGDKSTKDEHRGSSVRIPSPDCRRLCCSKSKLLSSHSPREPVIVLKERASASAKEDNNRCSGRHLEMKEKTVKERSASVEKLSELDERASTSKEKCKERTSFLERTVNKDKLVTKEKLSSKGRIIVKDKSSKVEESSRKRPISVVDLIGTRRSAHESIASSISSLSNDFPREQIVLSTKSSVNCSAAKSVARAHENTSHLCDVVAEHYTKSDNTKDGKTSDKKGKSSEGGIANENLKQFSLSPDAMSDHGVSLVTSSRLSLEKVPTSEAGESDRNTSSNNAVPHEARNLPKTIEIPVPTPSAVSEVSSEHCATPSGDEKKEKGEETDGYLRAQFTPESDDGGEIDHSFDAGIIFTLNTSEASCSGDLAFPESEMLSDPANIETPPMLCDDYASGEELNEPLRSFSPPTVESIERAVQKKCFIDEFEVKKIAEDLKRIELKKLMEERLGAVKIAERDGGYSPEDYLRSLPPEEYQRSFEPSPKAPESVETASAGEEEMAGSTCVNPSCFSSVCHHSPSTDKSSFPFSGCSSPMDSRSPSSTARQDSSTAPDVEEVTNSRNSTRHRKIVDTSFIGSSFRTFRSSPSQRTAFSFSGYSSPSVSDNSPSTSNVRTPSQPSCELEEPSSQLSVHLSKELGTADESWSNHSDINPSKSGKATISFSSLPCKSFNIEEEGLNKIDEFVKEYQEVEKQMEKNEEVGAASEAASLDESLITGLRSEQYEKKVSRIFRSQSDESIHRRNRCTGKAARIIAEARNLRTFDCLPRSLSKSVVRRLTFETVTSVYFKENVEMLFGKQLDEIIRCNLLNSLVGYIAGSMAEMTLSDIYRSVVVCSYLSYVASHELDELITDQNLIVAWRQFRRKSIKSVSTSMTGDTITHLTKTVVISVVMQPLMELLIADAVTVQCMRLYFEGMIQNFIANVLIENQLHIVSRCFRRDVSRAFYETVSISCVNRVASRIYLTAAAERLNESLLDEAALPFISHSFLVCMTIPVMNVTLTSTWPLSVFIVNIKRQFQTCIATSLCSMMCQEMTEELLFSVFINYLVDNHFSKVVCEVLAEVSGRTFVSIVLPVFHRESLKNVILECSNEIISNYLAMFFRQSILNESITAILRSSIVKSIQREALVFFGGVLLEEAITTVVDRELSYESSCTSVVETAMDEVLYDAVNCSFLESITILWTYDFVDSSINYAVLSRLETSRIIYLALPLIDEQICLQVQRFIQVESDCQKIVASIFVELIDAKMYDVLQVGFVRASVEVVAQSRADETLHTVIWDEVSGSVSVTFFGMVAEGITFEVTKSLVDTYLIKYTIFTEVALTSVSIMNDIVDDELCEILIRHICGPICVEIRSDLLNSSCEKLAMNLSRIVLSDEVLFSLYNILSGDFILSTSLHIIMREYEISSSKDLIRQSTAVTTGNVVQSEIARVLHVSLMNAVENNFLMKYANSCIESALSIALCDDLITEFISTITCHAVLAIVATVLYDISSTDVTCMAVKQAVDSVFSNRCFTAVVVEFVLFQVISCYFFEKLLGEVTRNIVNVEVTENIIIAFLDEECLAVLSLFSSKLFLHGTAEIIANGCIDDDVGEKIQNEFEEEQSRDIFFTLIMLQIEHVCKLAWHDEYMNLFTENFAKILLDEAVCDIVDAELGVLFGCGDDVTDLVHDIVGTIDESDAQVHPASNTSASSVTPVHLCLKCSSTNQREGCCIVCLFEYLARGDWEKARKQERGILIELASYVREIDRMLLRTSRWKSLDKRFLDGYATLPAEHDQIWVVHSVSEESITSLMRENHRNLALLSSIASLGVDLSEVRRTEKNLTAELSYTRRIEMNLEREYWSLKESVAENVSNLRANLATDNRSRQRSLRNIETILPENIGEMEELIHLNNEIEATIYSYICKSYLEAIEAPNNQFYDELAVKSTLNVLIDAVECEEINEFIDDLTSFIANLDSSTAQFEVTPVEDDDVREVVDSLCLGVEIEYWEIESGLEERKIRRGPPFKYDKYVHSGHSPLSSPTHYVQIASIKRSQTDIPSYAPTYSRPPRDEFEFFDNLPENFMEPEGETCEGGNDSDAQDESLDNYFPNSGITKTPSELELCLETPLSKEVHSEPSSFQRHRSTERLFRPSTAPPLTATIFDQTYVATSDGVHIVNIDSSNPDTLDSEQLTGTNFFGQQKRQSEPWPLIHPIPVYPSYAGFTQPVQGGQLIRSTPNGPSAFREVQPKPGVLPVVSNSQPNSTRELPLNMSSNFSGEASELVNRGSHLKTTATSSRSDSPSPSLVSQLHLAFLYHQHLEATQVPLPVSFVSTPVSVAYDRGITSRTLSADRLARSSGLSVTVPCEKEEQSHRSVDVTRSNISVVSLSNPNLSDHHVPLLSKRSKAVLSESEQSTVGMGFLKSSGTDTQKILENGSQFFRPTEYRASNTQNRSRDRDVGDEDIIVCDEVVKNKKLRMNRFHGLRRIRKKDLVRARQEKVEGSSRLEEQQPDLSAQRSVALNDDRSSPRKGSGALPSIYSGLSGSCLEFARKLEFDGDVGLAEISDAVNNPRDFIYRYIWRCLLVTNPFHTWVRHKESVTETQRAAIIDYCKGNRLLFRAFSKFAKYLQTKIEDVKPVMCITEKYFSFDRIPTIFVRMLDESLLGTNMTLESHCSKSCSNKLPGLSSPPDVMTSQLNEPTSIGVLEDIKPPDRASYKNGSMGSVVSTAGTDFPSRSHSEVLEGGAVEVSVPKYGNKRQRRKFNSELPVEFPSRGRKTANAQSLTDTMVTLPGTSRSRSRRKKSDANVPLRRSSRSRSVPHRYEAEVPPIRRPRSRTRSRSVTRRVSCLQGVSLNGAHNSRSKFSGGSNDIVFKRSSRSKSRTRQVGLTRSPVRTRSRSRTRPQSSRLSRADSRRRSASQGRGSCRTRTALRAPSRSHTPSRERSVSRSNTPSRTSNGNRSEGASRSRSRTRVVPQLMKYDESGPPSSRTRSRSRSREVSLTPSSANSPTAKRRRRGRSVDAYLSSAEKPSASQSSRTQRRRRTSVSSAGSVTSDNRFRRPRKRGKNVSTYQEEGLSREYLLIDAAQRVISEEYGRQAVPFIVLMRIMEEVLIAEKRGDDLRKFELSDPGYVYGTEKLPKGRRQKRKPKVEMLPMIELFELLFKAGIGVNIAISDQEKEFCVQSNCEQSEYQIFKFNVWLEEENIRRGYQREAILLNDPSVKAAANFLRSINFFAEF